MTVTRDPTDAALLEQAVAICHTGREVGRRIGTRDARVSLIRAGKARLTAAQRTKLEALLASPPIDLLPPGPTPSTTPDGKLLDAARALPTVGTYAALAALLGVSAEHLSRVRAGRASLGVPRHAYVREILRAGDVPIRRLDSHVVDVDGRVLLTKLARRLSIVLRPKMPVETLGGYIMARLGRAANVGERVECEGLTLVVTDAAGRLVRRVQIDMAGRG